MHETPGRTHDPLLRDCAIDRTPGTFAKATEPGWLARDASAGAADGEPWTWARRHLDALAALFVEVLKLCRAAGMVKLGRVALDGSKVRANASRRKAMSYTSPRYDEDPSGSAAGVRLAARVERRWPLGAGRRTASWGSLPSPTWPRRAMSSSRCCRTNEPMSPPSSNVGTSQPNNRQRPRRGPPGDPERPGQRHAHRLRSSALQRTRRLRAPASRPSGGSPPDGRRWTRRCGEPNRS